MFSLKMSVVVNGMSIEVFKTLLKAKRPFILLAFNNLFYAVLML